MLMSNEEANKLINDYLNDPEAKYYIFAKNKNAVQRINRGFSLPEVVTICEWIKQDMLKILAGEMTPETEPSNRQLVEEQDDKYIQPSLPLKFSDEED